MKYLALLGIIDYTVKQVFQTEAAARASVQRTLYLPISVKLQMVWVNYLAELMGRLILLVNSGKV